MNVSSRTIVLAAAALAASTSIAFAQQKDAMVDQMLRISAKADTAKAAGNLVLADQLKAQYDALSARLGGDDPARAASLLQQGSTGGPQNVLAPLPCGGGTIGSTLTFNGTTGPIVDVTTQSFTCTVAGFAATAKPFDVDMLTNITHTYAADLDITLTSAAGTVVNITHDNGLGNDNVFSNTLWDDQSANPVATYAYVNLVAAPNLHPEGTFASLRTDAFINGTWTLTITDDAGIDTGALNSWSLTITDGTVNPPTYSAPTTFTSSPAIAVPDLATVTDTITATGLGTSCEEVRLYTEITHTWNSDLIISLTSPIASNITGTVSNRRGGQYNDVFNGTVWDQSSANGVSTYAFVADGVVTPLRPEGDFTTGFDGLDPNGVWTLTISDNAGADIGALARWDLTIITCGASLPTAYCTSGTSTNNCVPSISADDQPSVGMTTNPTITIANLEGQKFGIIFYGINNSGFVPAPWAVGSNSFLCVKGPTQRTGSSSSGGTLNACDGVLSLVWNTYQTANPLSVGNPWSAGDKVYVQGWYRDPPAPKTTNLSNALEMTMVP
jgi:subtilisin-like proprotein convertase family protein